jgi:hypothetical protein
MLSQVVTIQVSSTSKRRLAELESSQQAGATFEDQSVSLQQARAELAAIIITLASICFFMNINLNQIYCMCIHPFSLRFRSIFI